MKSPNFSLPTRLFGILLTGLLFSLTTTADHNTPEALEARTAPEGKLNVVAAGAVAVEDTAGAGAPQSGEAVYAGVCAVCHDAGIAGAPKTGDVEAWRARIAQGMAVLEGHAINGFQGEAGVMAPRGGNAALSDEEVEAAVIHMVERSQ